MISLYLEHPSWLHRCATHIKLLALLLTSIALLAVSHLLVLAGVLCGIALLYGSLQPRGWRHLSAVRPLLPFIAAVLLIHLLSDTLTEGIVAMARLLALFLVANLVSLTTRMSDMIHTLQPCFKPLRYLGIEPRALALAIALMVRFAPVLVNVFENLDEAWRARGGRKRKWRLLVPLFIQGITLSEHLSEALAARGGSMGFENRAQTKESKDA